MHPSKVLVTGKTISQEAIDLLAEAGFETDLQTGKLSEADLAKHVEGCRAYLLGGDEYVSTKVLEHADSLEIIGFMGTGYEAFIDVEAARQKGITITNTPGASSTSVAESVMAHLLNLNNGIAAQNNERKNGISNEPLRRRDLSGQRLGIIGFGAVGEKVAYMARLGFGMQVSYFSRTRKPQVERTLDVTYLPLSDLLATVDFVVILLPRNSSTIGMLGKREIAHMKPGMRIINLSRPDIIDAPSLYDGLMNGPLGSASFDIYYTEPVPPSTQDIYKLLSLPDNLFILTSRSGSLTYDARDRASQMAAQSIIHILSGQTDPYVVVGHR